MKTINFLKIGSRIYDNEIMENVIINNVDKLRHVIRLWGKKYTGVRITPDNIYQYYWDFNIIPSYHNGSTLKLSFFNEGNYGRPNFVFYGKVVNQKRQYITLNESGSVHSFSADISPYEPFVDIYYKRGNTTTHLKYLHEMDFALNNNKIYGYLHVY